MENTSNKLWACTLCGYVHKGDQAPERCPVCGAPADLFELRAKQPAPQEKTPNNRWRCMVCEYVHQGTSPPNSCPVCNARADGFEPHVQESESKHGKDQARRIVIVGAGIAGVSAAQAVRETSAGAEIVLLSNESEEPYYRLNLTRYLAGEIEADALKLHPSSWYEMEGVDLQLNSELVGMDLEAKRLSTRNGHDLGFDKLILAAGSHPFIPPFPGAARRNVVSLRTRGDADSILEKCSGGARCVCIGGGLLGLETAGALARRGADVSLLEGHGWLLPRQLTESAGRRLESHVEAAGVSLHRKARTKELVGDDVVRGVLLENGTTIPADLVVLATGVRPNSYLARMAGLQTSTGVIVDDHLNTSHPDVYAAGDAAEHRGVAYGLWGPAQFQGTIAGMNAAGEEAEFVGVPRSNTLKVLGVDLFSIGEIRAADGSYASIEHESGEGYYSFIFRDSHLVGAILLGDAILSASLKKLIERRVDCSEIIRNRPALSDSLNLFQDLASNS